MTPQAGCSCSTVIPSATASGDANAATTSLIGPTGISPASSTVVQSAVSRSRNRAGQERTAAPPRRSTRVAVRREARVLGEGRQSEHGTEPPPLTLRPDRDRDRAVSRRRTSRKARCSGERSRAGPGDRLADECVLRLVHQAGQRGAEDATRPPAGRDRPPLRPVALAADQRGQDADRPEHPGHDVADRHADLGRRAPVRVGGAGDRHQAARGLDDEVVAGPVRRRAARARSR